MSFRQVALVPYTGVVHPAMANDNISVMDGYGLKSAHLVGMSFGGIIAQRVAVGHPIGSGP
jgi:pimeloyl-ACP methyl ester carboxylesterase